MLGGLKGHNLYSSVVWHRYTVGSFSLVVRRWMAVPQGSHPVWHQAVTERGYSHLLASTLPLCAAVLSHKCDIPSLLKDDQSTRMIACQYRRLRSLRDRTVIPVVEKILILVCLPPVWTCPMAGFVMSEFWLPLMCSRVCVCVCVCARFVSEGCRGCAVFDCLTLRIIGFSCPTMDGQATAKLFNLVEPEINLQSARCLVVSLPD